MKWLLLRPVSVVRAGAVACALAAVAPSVARADQIDRVLVNDSADVAERVAGLKSKYIAVLPFRVKIGSQPATFKQGLEGVQMANKLQNLLVLTNPDDKAGQYTVLSEAAKAAADAGKARGKAIDWTTAEGRKALLGLQLPVVWDDTQKHAPDTYLTGELTLTADLKGATVKLMTFSTKDGGQALVPLCNLQESATAKIRVDRNTLADLGKSFAVSKSVFQRPHPKTVQGRTKAVTDPDDAASESATGTGGSGMTAAPGSEGFTTFANCPVELTVLENGQPVAINPDGSSNFKLSRTPTPGTNLSFNLRNTGDKPVAVLLTIDGVNVVRFNPDERADVNANREKWRKLILQPASSAPAPGYYTIKGWMKSEDGKNDSLITVDAEDKSATRFAAMQPATAGKIELMVYPANSETGTIPEVTGGSTPAGGGTTPAGGGSTGGSTDAPTQADESTDASPMEQMDKSLGKTKSARAAKEQLLTKQLKGFKVEPAKKSLAIKPPASAPKMMGKTKGLAMADGGATFESGGTSQKDFVHAAAPSASVTITYYTPEMAGQPATGGN